MTETGTVKRWKGSFGFIAPDSGGEDIFVHQSVIKLEGYRALVPNEKVQFDIEVEEGGRKKAINLTGPNGGELKGLWDEGEEHKTGTVARWRMDKGFGFIKPEEEGAEDIFVHRSVIQCLEENDPALQMGETVQYTVIEENGRTKAGKVTGANGRPVKGVPKEMAGGMMGGSYGAAPMYGAPPVMGGYGGYGGPMGGGGYGGAPMGGGGYGAPRFSPYGGGGRGGGRGRGRY
uniref:CSD domain-containing protein n=1 Tax=Pyramimonas obovata TaxID=1411642 RepID=A0A6T7VLH0_9CHLO|mmetsp:Transcript_22043/g.48370  ORF Transcript_22043/g.48370 Transcript_22043/m.48370 type:complete len:232 (+) Transcript_22043:325-1020(+)